MKKSMSLLLVLALLLTGVLGGCGAPAGNAQSKAPAASAALSADTEIVAGAANLADSMDPYTSTQGIEATSRNSIYDSLLAHDENGKIVGRLAESWEFNEDGTLYTFHLRDDITFSNGDPITAEDVAWSIQMMADSPYRGWLYAGLYDHCEVVDERTVQVHFMTPAVFFEEYFAVINGAPILSKSFYESCNGKYGTSVDTVLSSGPYVMTGWVPDEYITYEAREDYYRGAPEIKKAKLVPITDMNAVAVALQTGECHIFMDDLQGSSYASIEKVPNVTVTPCPSLITYYTYFNCEKGLFSDARMRQAVAYACNREDMVAAGASGYGYVPNYLGDRGEGNELQGDPKFGDINPYKPDVEKAKALVKEAGQEGANVVIKTYGTDPYPALATVLQAQLSAIGLNATVTQMERSTLSSECLDNRDYEIMIVRASGVGNEMDEYFYGSLYSGLTGSNGNWGGLYTRAADLDPLLFASRAASDPEERAKIFRQILDIYFEEMPYVLLYFQDGSRAHNSGLTVASAQAPDNSFYNYHFAG